MYEKNRASTSLSQRISFVYEKNRASTSLSQRISLAERSDALSLLKPLTTHLGLLYVQGVLSGFFKKA